MGGPRNAPNPEPGGDAPIHRNAKPPMLSWGAASPFTGTMAEAGTPADPPPGR
jgi:hypothetical protein